MRGRVVVDVDVLLLDDVLLLLEEDIIDKERL